MKTILVVNQKGGTGKTTICDELAFACERAGIVYDFYDLDFPSIGFKPPAFSRSAFSSIFSGKGVNCKVR